jgi:hypothetical protein
MQTIYQYEQEMYMSVKTWKTDERNGVTVTYTEENLNNGNVKITALVVSTYHKSIKQDLSEKIVYNFEDTSRNRGIFNDSVRRAISFQAFLAGNLGDKLKFGIQEWHPNVMLPCVIGGQAPIVSVLTFNTTKTRPHEAGLISNNTDD